MSDRVVLFTEQDKNTGSFFCLVRLDWIMTFEIIISSFNGKGNAVGYLNATNNEIDSIIENNFGW